MRVSARKASFSLFFFGAIGCTGRSARVLPTPDRQETASVLERFVAYRLDPARVAPPSLGSSVAVATANGITGRAELVLPEDATWNQWEDGSLRLFNNRAAHLFRVEVASDRPVRWMAGSTTLELNEEGNLFRAAQNQEELLEELLFWAYHQERQVIDGDLAERIRGAGAFRAEYLPAGESVELHQGLIAFPLRITDENRTHYEHVDPSDLHVVSMRLSMVLVGENRVEELVWLFE